MLRVKYDVIDVERAIPKNPKFLIKTILKIILKETENKEILKGVDVSRIAKKED